MRTGALDRERMEQLERAARLGLRVVLMRRGTEYIVVARRRAPRSAGTKRWSGACR